MLGIAVADARNAMLAHGNVSKSVMNSGGSAGKDAINKKIKFKTWHLKTDTSTAPRAEGSAALASVFRATSEATNADEEVEPSSSHTTDHDKQAN